MIILTKQQEHKVYVALLKHMTYYSDVSESLCRHLHYILDDDATMPSFWEFKTGEDKMVFCLPTLNNMKPEVTNGLYWFSLDETGFQKRIELVRKAIELTK